MLVKQRVIGIFKNMWKHVYKTRNCIWCHLQDMAIFTQFEFGCKDGPVTEQHANTTVHWLSTLLLPIVAKSSILNMAEFLDPSLKTLPWKKTTLVLCENQSFCYHFEMLPPLLKVIVFFSVTFYSMMKYFWSAF